MIYTLTFNPAIDYIVHLGQLKPGEINRSKSESIYPGGKGINVAVILDQLDIPSKVFGFTAGLMGTAITLMLGKTGIATDFISLDSGETRINIKLLAAPETVINCNGPKIKESDVDKMLEKLKTLKQGDTLVMSGAIPPGVYDDIYEVIMDCLAGQGVRFVIDASGKLLANTLSKKPFLIKPNKEELEEIFGVAISNEEELIGYGKKLQERGAANVIISLAENGAILFAENGKVYKGISPKGTLVNSSGAGDSMVAGFLAGIEKGMSHDNALRLGLAAGAGTAFTQWLAEGEDIKKLVEKTEIVVV